MPGAAAELMLGPFSGGINQFSDKSAIADDDLVDCINFDIDLDGSLKSRPPWSVLHYGPGTANLTSFQSNPYRAVILGTYVYNGVRFIVFMNRYSGPTPTYTQAFYIYYLDGPSAGTVATVNMGINIAFTTSIRYEDILYFIPDPALPDTSGVSYNLATGTATEISAMPQGNSAVVYKDTLYIGGGRTGLTATSPNKSRLFFSAIADFTTWPGSNFFDINPGDGDAVQDFLLYQDNILIAKDNATYVLAYDTSPAQAVVKQVNGNIGVKGPYCMVPYENSIFFLQYSQVYEMSNYDFTRVSTKLPFTLDQTINNPYFFSTLAWRFPVFLRRVGDRLVVRFYNNLYIYHLRIRSWTRWVSNDTSIQYLGPPWELDRTNSTTVLGYESFVASTALNRQVDVVGEVNVNNATLANVYTKIFRLNDTYEANTLEDGNSVPASVLINCSLLSKVYDIGISHRFKRLMHWGVDVVTGSDVTGTLYPLALSYRVKWKDINGKYTWSQLNTWGYPLFQNPSTTQISPVSNRVDRRFIRFPKSLRFRLLQFKIEVSTQGNLADGPARLYTLTAFIASKELVPKAVN